MGRSDEIRKRGKAIGTFKEVRDEKWGMGNNVLQVLAGQQLVEIPYLIPTVAKSVDT